MKTKFILPLIAFLVFSFLASAQPGKAKAKKPNNFSWGESSPGTTKVKSTTQQSNAGSQNMNSTNRSTKGNKGFLDDSLQSIKSPKGNIKQPAGNRARVKPGTR